jgi:VWFA-related protein
VALVTALDADDNPVPGLTRASFRVEIDGQPASVGEVGSGLDNALGLAVILAVDTSGSMAGGPIEAAKQAIRPLVRSLRQGDRAAILAFANQAVEVVSLTSDGAALDSGLASLVARDNTALYAAVTRAAALASAAPEPRKAVVLLSDGEEFGNASGGVTRQQALDGAVAGAAPFFVVGLGKEVDRPFLVALGDQTGGEFLAAASATDLARLYQRISNRLRLQYRVGFSLPSGLAGGGHRVVVRVGSTSAESSFTTASPVRAVGSFEGLGETLDVPVTVRLSGVAQGVRVRFEIDGRAAQPDPDGRSIRLDPRDFDPIVPHTLAAFPGSATATESITKTFLVAALPPVLVAPRTLPGLRAGDLVRLTVGAQPGTAIAVSYVIDGGERERDVAAPFEFTIPADGLAGGDHTLVVVLESAAGSTEQRFPFRGADAGGSNASTYTLAILLILVGLAGAGVGGHRLLRSRKSGRPVGQPGVTDASIPLAATPVPWGELLVMEGRDRGQCYPLEDDVELVGRGKSCSVRPRDRSLANAHFLLTRDGDLQASSPACRVEIDGREARSGRVNDGATVRAGQTLLRFRRL